MNKKNVAVIFGGVSSEHAVSCISATSVITNLDKEKYNIYMLGITLEGRWYLYEGDVSCLADDKWIDESHITPAYISPDAGIGGITVLREGRTEHVALDVIFPVLHGKNGEDGTIQGLFQLSGIPFVGCDTVSSAVCMDKAFTNTIADQAKILQAKWIGTIKSEYDKNEVGFLNHTEQTIGFPVFIKPANAGSSVGVSKANNLEQLREGCEKAFKEDTKIVLEEFIDGYEVECAVLGNEQAQASTVGEILPAGEFYDYEAKYISGESGLAIPAANIDGKKIEEVRAAALKAYKALGCSGLARVDFFVGKKDGKVYFNEINTLPGFTSISMYPKLWNKMGVGYSELLDKLIDLALQRGGKI